MYKRHSRSFFFSLSFHIVVLGVIVAVWAALMKESQPKEERLQIACQCYLKKETPPEPVQPQALPSQPPKAKPQKIAPATPVKKERPTPKPKAVTKKTAPLPKKKVVLTKEVPIKEPQPVVSVPKTEKTNVKEPVMPFSLMSAATPKQTNVQSYSSSYTKLNIKKIKALIAKSVYYPKQARRRHVEGVVKVRFDLHEDGSISNIKVINSAHELLDSAATKTIQKLQGRFPKPQERVTLVVPIAFKLR